MHHRQTCVTCPVLVLIFQHYVLYTIVCLAILFPLFQNIIKNQSTKNWCIWFKICTKYIKLCWLIFTYILTRESTIHTPPFQPFYVNLIVYISLLKTTETFPSFNFINYLFTNIFLISYFAINNQPVRHMLHLDELGVSYP